MNEVTRIQGELLTSIAPEGSPEKPSTKLKAGRIALMLLVPLLLAGVGLYYWLTSGKTVSTDNAQIGAHVVSIAPEVGGRVTEVFVTENQRVKAGDLLFRIDPEPYRIALPTAASACSSAMR
jgi:membrane fusion protein, multidrug efflux system